MDVNITKVEILLGGDHRNILGYASVTIDDSFVIRNIRIVQGGKGVFLGMPAGKTASRQYIDLAFPINQSVRAHLTGVVMEEFRRLYPDKAEGIKIHSPENFVKLR